MSYIIYSLIINQLFLIWTYFASITNFRGNQQTGMNIEGYMTNIGYQPINTCYQGQGKVIYALNGKDHQKYALKMINVSKILKNPYFEKMVTQQIKIHEQLSNSSQYIIKFQQMLKTANSFYFVYEYCNGGNLSHFIEKNGHLSEKQAILWLEHLLQALQVIWDKKLTHRFLTTRNIFLHQNSIRLTHFGYCKIEGASLSLQDIPQRLLAYLAPEVLKGEPYTIQSDIWSLGVIVYQMILGRIPFEYNPDRQVPDLIKFVSINQPCFPPKNPVSKPLQNLIRKCLIKDPAQRIQREEIFLTYKFKNGQIFHQQFTQPGKTAMCGSN